MPRCVSAMEVGLTHLRRASERCDYAIGDPLPSEAPGLCAGVRVVNGPSECYYAPVAATVGRPGSLAASRRG